MATSTKSLRIEFPSSDQSSSTQVLYFRSISGQEIFGGFLQPYNNVVQIPLKQGAVEADGLTAFVFRPGCKMTSYHFDGAVGESTTQQFSCEKLSVIRVRALIRNRQDLPASNLETVLSCGGVLKELNHKVTHWPVGIQVAVYPTSSDDSLYLDLPDFANDPVFLHLFSKPAFGLEVKMQLPDRASVGMLRLVANTPSQQTLWIAPTYPSELLFDFVPK